MQLRKAFFKEKKGGSIGIKLTLFFLIMQIENIYSDKKCKKASTLIIILFITCTVVFFVNKEIYNKAMVGRVDENQNLIDTILK